ncbi:MAG: ATP-binding protein [Bacilli bacterium]|nr:ATP-binding protein [Bacilli bacterium]
MERIERKTYLKRLIDSIDNGMVKVITGLRRSGKSYLLNILFYEYLVNDLQVKESHIIRFSFDNPADLSLLGENFISLKRERRKADPAKFFDYVSKLTRGEGHYFVLLDEVQELEAFEYVLNGLLEKGNLDIYITGSNAKFLSRDIITEFRGRGYEIHVYPLSFSECASFYDKDAKKALDKYLVYGGLPMVVLAKSDEDRVSYLETQLKSTYLSDIIERYNIRNEEGLQELLLFLASSTSCLVNPKKLAARFASLGQASLSEASIAKYIDYFAEAFLLRKALRFDIKGSKYLSTPYKVYFEDLGIRNALLSFRQHEVTHLMENAIFNELLRQGYKVDVGQVEVREESGGVEKRKYLETDFVANMGDARFYIQSVYSLESSDKKEAELKSLKNIKDGFKKVVILANNLADGYDEKGVYYLDLNRFLLNEKNL